MIEKILKKDIKISFKSEGRLLQELGERLVASSEVAIVELIKNSYDADSPDCNVSLENDSLIIKDRGHGMTEEDFINKWMKIASGSKEKDKVSPLYQRKLTGAKGIGRFAARFLGATLTLSSIAYDKTKKKKTRISAVFDWTKFDNSKNLQKAPIKYTLYEAAQNISTGTKLTITHLSDDIRTSFNREVKTEILKIVNPLGGLESGHLSRRKGKSEKDPGFQVVLPSDDEDINIAENILKNYWAKITVSLLPYDATRSANLVYKIYFSQEDEHQKNQKQFVIHSQRYKSKIKKGLFADIRFFPRRGGIFSGKGFKGNDAWSWIKKNQGVAVVDHSFRIKPYGYPDDDWLNLSADSATSKRKWRTDIMNDNFPIPPEIMKLPKLNPMLYLPGNHQLIGAVFVESGHKGKSSSDDDLIPSTDREGYLDNNAFSELEEVIRAGMEMLALKDKQEEERKEKDEAEQAFKEARDDVKQAIKHIETIPTLTEKDKNRLVIEYSNAYKNIEKAEEYSRQARQSLETMSLLGVVAGYMTHENKRTLFDLKQLIETVKSISRKSKEIRDAILPLENSYKELQGQIEYSELFIGAVQDSRTSSFNVISQVEFILDRFGHHAKKRGVEIEISIGNDVVTPEVPISLYSGILINLFTNSLKAVIADSTPKSKHTIAFKAWNEDRKHVLEVLDNGIGIPPTLRKRIWDPLFTTTSNLNNPFGSGMGLGLNLVKKLLGDIGGTISLISPPPDYTTCFKVVIPFKKGER